MLVNAVKKAIQSRVINRGHKIRELKVEIDNETITLSGQTASSYVKQLAQEATRSASGQLRILNQIEVDR